MCHDNDLERLTGMKVSITTTDFESLPRLRKYQELTFYGGHSITVEHNNNNIPRLREVFEEFPQFPVNIDLKYASDELMEKVHELVCEFNRESVTVWGSVYSHVCTRLYAIDPNIPLFFSMKRGLVMYILLMLGLLPFWHLRESCFEFCVPSLTVKRSQILQSQIPWLARCLLCCDTFLLHRLLCFHFQRRGIKVYLWVLNEEEDYDFAVRLRVDGIMTDYPTRLKEYYDARRGSDPARRLLQGQD